MEIGKAIQISQQMESTLKDLNTFNRLFFNEDDHKDILELLIQASGYFMAAELRLKNKIRETKMSKLSKYVAAAQERLLPTWGGPVSMGDDLYCIDCEEEWDETYTLLTKEELKDYTNQRCVECGQDVLEVAKRFGCGI